MATVIVYSLSRTARSLRDLLHILAVFDANEVRLVSLSENVDTSTPAGRLFISVLGAVNQFEREILVERTLMGLEQARKNGKVLGGKRRNTRPPTKAHTAMSAAVRSEQARAAYSGVLPDILAMRQEGRTFAEIADALNERGLRTRTGKQWRSAQVHRALAYH